MKNSLCAGAALLALSTTAFAQQPAVYPLRGQSAAARGVDSAYCYWQARQQTGVDMARLPQRPPRTKAVRFAPDAGKGASEPPLPPRGAAAPGAASAATARASGPASSATAGGLPGAAPGGPASGALSGSAAASGSATTAAGASSAATAGAANLPPLPPPEPPMTTYWHAYGACMQARGYGVQ